MSPGSAGLAIIGIGSVLGLLSPLGVIPIVSGSFLVSLGAILAAPESSRPGAWLESWWRLSALSAFVCLVGLGTWLLVPQLGVAVVMAGSLGALFSVAFGYPRKLTPR